MWGRERNINMKEKHRSAAFLYVPQPGIEPATWVCALTRNRTHNPQCTGMYSNQLSHTGQGQFLKRFYLFFYRERKGRGKTGRETSIGCLSHTPNQGPGPQPQHVLWLGIEWATFQFTGWHSTHWVITARAQTFSWLNVLQAAVSLITYWSCRKVDFDNFASVYVAFMEEWIYKGHQCAILEVWPHPLIYFCTII